MRRLLVVACALSALALAGPASAQTVSPGCGLPDFPALGNIHRFVGEPVTYTVTNTDTRYFDIFIAWGDVPPEGSFPGLYPGDSYEFSHTYTTPGSYSPVAYIHVADSTNPIGVCTTSFTLGTVRVRGHARG
jgi:hypothetical protein